MHVVCKTYQSHIVWYSQACLLNSVEGCESDDIVEGEDGIWTVVAAEQIGHGLHSPSEVYLSACHKVAVNGYVVFSQRLKISMLAAAHHVEMVGTSDESYSLAACVYEMLGGLLGSLIAICHDARELVRQACPAKEYEGDAHVGYLFKMRIVGGILRQTGYDALYMHADKVV